MFQVVGLELMLKSYSERKPFGLEVWKDYFAGKTIVEDLADRTA